MKIYKIADIIADEFLLTEKGKSRSLNPLAILTNLDSVESPHPDFKWNVEIKIGKGTSARELKLNLPFLISTLDSLEEPLLIKNMPLNESQQFERVCGLNRH